MTRWIKIPGPGQFRGEGEWRSLEECYTDDGRIYPEHAEAVWKRAQGYLPTREQETKPEESSGKDPVLVDLLVSLMCLTVAMLIGMTVGAKVQQTLVRQEAVLRGVAVYVPGDNGEPIFTWKEIKSE